MDGWLLGQDTADVPLGRETRDGLCASYRIGDKRLEENEQDLKLPQRSKMLLRTRVEKQCWDLCQSLVCSTVIIRPAINPFITSSTD